MYQINNEVFGELILKTRKEKQLTQKELGDLLYVSDKTVSKWERGLSIPNVCLLAPIAEVLDINIEELLQTGNASENRNNDVLQVYREDRKRKRMMWKLAYGISVIITILELYLLLKLGVAFETLRNSVGLISVFTLVFGGWFCLFVKETLPSYYDKNKVNYFAQGLCRIHMPGIAFHNGNWPYICFYVKLWCLCTAIIIPLLCLSFVMVGSIDLWKVVSDYVVGIVLFGMLITMYIVAKKYE